MWHGDGISVFYGERPRRQASDLIMLAGKRGFQLKGTAWFRKYFGEPPDLRARLFNLFAFVGALIGLCVVASNIVIGTQPVHIALNLASSALAVFLLWYANKTGRFELCYIITIVVVFLVFFPILFFTAGGYRSGIPSFFVFAVTFTAMMLRGKKMFIFCAAELILYCGICLAGYLRPSLVTHFASEWELAFDVATGFVLASLALVFSMVKSFRAYDGQAGKLEAANSAKTAFLANISHEIRTPVNVMMGMNEMIRSAAPPGPIAEWSREVQAAGYALRDLIDELLDISKIEAGRQEIVQVEYRVMDLIYELSLVGEQETRKRGLAFAVQADQDMPSKLCGDFSRVRQIVTNFLVNAAKYTESGTVTLTADAGGAGANGRENAVLRLSVSDTGVGIKQEDMNSLFEKFVRAEGGNFSGRQLRRTEGGVGLGLAIAKQLTDLMGGEIKVESVPGEGSVFTLLIPQRLVDPAPMGDWRAGAFTPARTPSSGESGTFIAPSGRVLAVDDNLGNLRVVREFLGRTRLRVDTAQGGRECVQAVKRAMEDGEPYQVILMDYMMPDMDGIETLKRLRETIPDFDIPVVALTADAIRGEREKFLGAVFAAYLSKPVARRDLEHEIFALLPRDMTEPGGGTPETPAVPKEWDDELSAHGVSLSEGLKYSSGDVALFRTQASIFAENFVSERAAIEARMDEGDWAGMTRLAHSLKSRAGYAGAVDLRETALKVERACRAKDAECARLALPLLFMEWERAYKGLGDFVRRVGETVTEAEETEHV